MWLKKENIDKNTPNNRDWKEKNKRYLFQLQKFLDAVDSIEKEELKNNIIAQMLKCDLILTELAEREIQKYKEGNV